MIYKLTIEALRRRIEQHETPSGRASIKAFAEAYGFSRQNLIEVLGQKQEVSVGLFLRLSAVLAGTEAAAVPPGVERWSLRTWLELDSWKIQQAMYSINFTD